MQLKILPSHNRYRIVLIAVLIAICFFLTYYFHVILRTGSTFNHFFYIPIILAAFWWQKKGLIVALFLAADLIISHIFLRIYVTNFHDYFRAILLQNQVFQEHTIQSFADLHSISKQCYNFLLHCITKMLLFHFL